MTFRVHPNPKPLWSYDSLSQAYLIKQVWGSPLKSSQIWRSAQSPKVLFLSMWVYFGWFFIYKGGDRKGGESAFGSIQDDLKGEYQQNWGMKASLFILILAYILKLRNLDTSLTKTTLSSILGQNLTKSIWKLHNIYIVQTLSAYRAGTLNCK